MANDSFTPYRGAEEKVLLHPVENGAVYFAYDTQKIYFDMNNQRYSIVGGAGNVAFYYSHQSEPQANDDGLFAIDLDAIDTSDGKTPKTDDILINDDNAFYRVSEISNNIAWCLKIASGGGGGTAVGRITISEIDTNRMPSTTATGLDISGSYMVKSNNRDDAGLRT